MPGCEKRVLVTGATGLIGKELVNPLLATGFEVYAITIDEHNPDNGIHWLKGSLFDDEFVTAAVRQVRPTHLLNMAWATTGDYLTNDVNYRFLHAGEVLAREFVAAGGRRAVYAGTCFEYRFKDEPIRECDALDPEKNAYTHCKNALRINAGERFAAGGVSFGFGRIFYVYGRNEAKTRLTGLVIDKLNRGENVVIKAGPLKKDYIYAKDIANAFVALLDSSVEGPVNICTGKAITIREYVQTLAGKLGRPELVEFADDCANQPPIVVGDNTRLTQEVGYSPRYGLDCALNEIVGEDK